MKRSVSFDRAADFYDATRGFPLGVGKNVAQKAAELVGQSARVLEIGIGTGRISLPLCRLVGRLYGIDISRKMMEKVREQTGPGDVCPALVQGDACALPFAAGSLDSVLYVHVLHLVSDWRLAVHEARRVLKPAGWILIGYTWYQEDSPSAVLKQKWNEFRQEAGDVPNRSSIRDFSEVYQFIEASGAIREEVLAAEWSTTQSIADEIGYLQNRIGSSTWSIPEEVHHKSISRLRTWAEDKYGSPEREYPISQRFYWQRFSWL